MPPKVRKVEAVIALLASRAHGVVTRRELLAAGITADEIKHRMGTGALIPEYRGVYRVGHRAPSVESSYLAAVRACGVTATLSGRSAAYLYGLVKGGVPAPEVSAPTERRASGVRTKRRNLDAAEVTQWRGIPVTSVPRTLVDLAPLLPLDELARACHAAQVRYRTTPAHVETVLARHPTQPAAGELRRVLQGDVRVTLSKLEARFLERLRTAGLPLPLTNRIADGRRVDCRWPEHRLTVEVDGYRFHASRHAWELDRRREREARARGDEFRRYTYGDVFESPRLMLAELRALLPHKRGG